MDVTSLNKLDNEAFKEYVGIPRSHFFQIVKRYTEQIPRPNRTRVLHPLYEVLVAFIYYRNHLSLNTLARTYKVSSSSIYRMIRRVETYLIKYENIQLSSISENNTINSVDSTETV